MNNNSSKYVWLVSLLICLLQAQIIHAYDNKGETIPKPVFQVGDKVSQPYPDGSDHAHGFVKFFNNTYLEKDRQIKVLNKKEVVWFPPQLAGDTSLEMVARTTEGETENCSKPGTYPIICDEGFNTGEFCKACHDSVLFVEGGGLAQMAYFSEPDEHHKVWLSNWSQYGDWSANIMRLATRDPIWQAQIETETSVHSRADPRVIEDVCFSCHGEMGERQLKYDHGYKQTFCTDIFYATIPDTLSKHERGKAYEFNDYCAPIQGKKVKDHPELYAKYGSLARDGVSCETCHRIGPAGGTGAWDGKDYSVFYGERNKYNVHNRQTENKYPLEYEFTATFDYDMNHILTPDPLDIVDAKPMKELDNIEIAHAYNEKDDVSYLRQSVLCGSCHVLIVPQIPKNYAPGADLPTSTYYKKPKACNKTKFDGAKTDRYGNPLTDECVALGYEQATYLEWINSDFASEKDNDDTCQGCHMPLVTNPKKPGDHTAIMAQSTDGLIPKVYRRHRLMGINLPVFEMFMQFPDVLGVAEHDDLVPPSGTASNGKQADYIQNNLLNGQMAIVEQATSQANGNGLKKNSSKPNPQAAVDIDIEKLKLTKQFIEAKIKVTNNTGHKFPSGAGFRRAFLKFEVLDKNGSVLWVSGQTNPYGAICDGPCVEKDDGTYNLVASETPKGMPDKLQPHYETINKQHQVQIYEVQAVNDVGELTSSTLALFHDAKDNRLLPRGWTSPDELGCKKNPEAGTTIFGISQCSASDGTKPQLKPLTKNSAIANDKYYSNAKYTGADLINYKIALTDISAQKKPASIRVTMEYQTIPPGYLAERFSDGFDKKKGKHRVATERSIYLTSHLNTNLPLKSEHPDNKDLIFSKNWTTSIYRATKSFKD